MNYFNERSTDKQLNDRLFVNKLVRRLGKTRAFGIERKIIHLEQIKLMYLAQIKAEFKKKSFILPHTLSLHNKNIWHLNAY